MKYLSLLFCLGVSQPAMAGDLKLEIHGSGLTGKMIYVSVYPAEHARDFPMHAQFASLAKMVASGDVAELFMPNMANGEYAVAVYADINGNHQLDTNILGIPKEPVGVSRDAKGRFGPPSFADAAFKIGDGITTLQIQLH